MNFLVTHASKSTKTSISTAAYFDVYKPHPIGNISHKKFGNSKESDYKMPAAQPGILDPAIDTSLVPVDALEPLRLRLSHVRVSLFFRN